MAETVMSAGPCAARKARSGSSSEGPKPSTLPASRLRYPLCRGNSLALRFGVEVGHDIPSPAFPMESLQDS